MNFLLKISGSGNRFLLADKRHFNQNKAPENWQNFITSPYPFSDLLKLADKNLAQRKSFLKQLLKKAPQTDGLVVLDSTHKNPNSRKTNSSGLNKKQTDKKLMASFYNKDGSKAEMCGNAACCLSFYIEKLSLPFKKFVLAQEEITLAKKGTVFLKRPSKNVLNFKTPLAFSFIDTGVPHGVIECSELDFEDKNKAKGLIKLNRDKKALKKSLKPTALKLRFKNIRKYKKGMNVSFYQVLSTQKLKAITYERGVEDWTLACGTGALAVSLVYLSKNQEKNKVWIQMPGGSLKVETGASLKLFSKVKEGF